MAEAIARLQDRFGGNGPYAAVFPTAQYADAHAPLPNTLVSPAEPIKALMTKGFFGSGLLPLRKRDGQNNPLGVVVDLGGDSMDRVVGRDATVDFLQEDPDGLYRFRVLERFALRVKVDTAIIALEFLSSSTSSPPSDQPSASRRPPS